MKTLVALVLACSMWAGSTVYNYQMAPQDVTVWSPCTAEPINLTSVWTVQFREDSSANGLVHVHQIIHESLTGVGGLSGFQYVGTTDWVGDGSMKLGVSFVINFEIHTTLTNPQGVAPAIKIRQVAHFQLRGDGTFGVVVDKEEVQCN